MSVGLLPCERRAGIPVSLAAQEALDAELRVLEQIFVGRSLPRHGHQDVAFFFGQRVSGELHRHQRPPRDGHREIHAPTGFVDPDERIGPGLQEPLRPKRVDVGAQALTQFQRLVRQPGAQPQFTADARDSIGGRPAELDGTNHRARARNDIEHEVTGFGPWCVERPRLHRGAEIPVVRVHFFDRPGHVGGPPQRRLRAETQRHGVPQHAIRQPGVPAEDETSHLPQRYEFNHYPDAAVSGFAVHPHVQVRAKPHEVHDRPAHGDRRQGLAGAHLDQAGHLRVAHLDAEGDDAHGGHRRAQQPVQRLRVRRLRPGGLCCQQQPHDGGKRRPHQKTCRTRTSTE